MASLKDICVDVTKEVSEALGFAVVDISSGLMLAVAHNVPYFTQSYLDAVAAAAVDMFRGKTITNVEKLLSATRGKEVKHLVQEIQMTTESTFHFMALVPGKPQCLTVLITSRKANLGLGWSSLRKALVDIAPLCP
jgi:hypothetical protein